MSASRLFGDHPGAARVGLAREVRELDRVAIEERGVPSAVLMESASRAVAEVAESLLGGSDRPALVLCGPGNNGGDGLAVARTLHNRGREVRVVRVGHERPEALGPDVRLQRRLLPPCVERAALDLDPGSGPGWAATTSEAFRLPAGAADWGLVVDALFGTGLARPLEGVTARLLEAADQIRAPRLAVDLPSGLGADDGGVLGPVLACQVTVTFAAWKRGLLVGQGPRLAGRVEVAEIGIPRDLVERLPTLAEVGLRAPAPEFAPDPE